MQAAGNDVSMCNLVVSRQCITPGTEGVYTAGCLVGCSLWLSGDAERKRSFVGVESEKERRSPVVRAFRSCYDRILFDSKLLTNDVVKVCHSDTLNMNLNPLRSRCYGGTLNIEAYHYNITLLEDLSIGDVRSIIR